MAKIYETRNDVIRDALDQEVQKQKNSKESLFNSGLLGVISGLGFFNIPFTSHTVQEGSQTIVKNSFMKSVSKCFGYASLLVGALSFALSFQSRTKEKEAALKLQAYGGKVDSVLPPDMQPGDEIPSGKYVSRLQNEQSADVVKYI